MNKLLPDGFAQYAKEYEEKTNAFIELNLDLDKAAVSSPQALSGEAGLPFAVSDNIAVKDMAFTCGSNLLKDLRSPYTATVVQKLENAGGTVIGKTNLDEFGMGCTGSSAFKKTNNPWNLNLSAGGATGGAVGGAVTGSAAAVAAGIVPYALCPDAGGSLRLPAALCGVVGLKPGYGAVSRYGLAAYASSMESIGVIADTVTRCRAVFDIIRGADPMDMTSRDAPQAALNTKAGPPTPKKIGVVSCIPEDTAAEWYVLAKDRLSALGHTLVDIKIHGLAYAAQAFYTIAAAEASSNLTRFDGIRLGARPAYAENPDELVEKTREAGFGSEVKLQILLGTHVLRSGFQEKFFQPALRIRAAIKAAFEALLGDSGYNEAAKFDAILMPVLPAQALAGNLSPFAQKAANMYNCCVSLTGLPALSFPVSHTKELPAGELPAGVQLVGRTWGEGTLLDIAEGYEQKYPFPRPKEFKAFWR